MKNKKGFTLIELLAIIVILAIIAVITVPIILNIIENAKEGTVKDSAYGYKDAVQKYYVTKSLENPNEELPSGYKNISELPSDLQVSGEHPTDGWVKLNKGQVEEYSLKIGEYVVTKTENNNVVATKTTEIAQQPEENGEETPTCPGTECVYRYSETQKYIANETTLNNNNYDTKLSSNEYTKDYTTLKDINNRDAIFFLGYILDESGNIQRSYVCGIEQVSEEVFCVEGGVNESGLDDKTVYSSNIGIVQNKIDCDNANINNTQSTCASKGVQIKISEYTYLNKYNPGVSFNQNGQAYIYQNTGEDCYIESDGKSYCEEDF